MRVVTVEITVCLALALCATLANSNRAVIDGLVGKPEQRINGSSVFRVEADNVNSLDSCARFLKERFQTLEAASFDQSRNCCFAVARNASYIFVAANNWFSFVFENVQSSTTVRTTRSSSTTPRATSARTTTSKPSNSTVSPLHHGFALFEWATNWTVPANVKVVTGLCIGGGGGGGACPGSRGGGSGYITFGRVNVTAGSKIQISIGQGGKSGQPGGSSSFGVHLIAKGGRPGDCSSGGDGGSGGGGGAVGKSSIYSSGSGGSGGSDGKTSGEKGDYPVKDQGGKGQGTYFWSQAFAAFKQVKLREFYGGEGFDNENKIPGGGGAGGLRVNNFYKKATHGTGLSTGGLGYGAGGGGRGCASQIDCVSGTGGSGAHGICVIEWD